MGNVLPFGRDCKTCDGRGQVRVGSSIVRRTLDAFFGRQAALLEYWEWCPTCRGEKKVPVELPRAQA